MYLFHYARLRERLNPPDGDNLHFEDKPLESIATGSLQNKIFFHLNEKLQRHSMQR